MPCPGHQTWSAFLRSVHPSRHRHCQPRADSPRHWTDRSLRHSSHHLLSLPRSRQSSESGQRDRHVAAGTVRSCRHQNWHSLGIQIRGDSDNWHLRHNSQECRMVGILVLRDSPVRERTGNPDWSTCPSGSEDRQEHAPDWRYAADRTLDPQDMSRSGDKSCRLQPCRDHEDTDTVVL